MCSSYFFAYAVCSVVCWPGSPVTALLTSKSYIPLLIELCTPAALDDIFLTCLFFSLIYKAMGTCHCYCHFLPFALSCHIHSSSVSLSLHLFNYLFHLKGAERSWRPRDHLPPVLWQPHCQRLWRQHAESLVSYHRKGKTEVLIFYFLSSPLVLITSFSSAANCRH